MTRILAALFATAALVAPASAVAGPTIGVPDCHQINDLLHIDNVRDCSGA